MLNRCPLRALFSLATMPDLSPLSLRRTWPGQAPLALAGLLAAVTLAPSAHAEVLYNLKTQCSVKGTAPVACTVEAVDTGGATEYRHRIGSSIETIRISDKPVRMEIWDGAGRRWRSLKRASALFSSNTVCFDGRDLCVVNPNYLNSVRESNSAAMTGRDLVKVAFGADGRINASCYDNGCEVTLR